LRYQDRVGYYEGVRGREVAGEQVDLIFAMAAYQEKTSDVPSSLRLRFYLDKDALPYFTVRERKEKTYYWLDRVVRQAQWRAGKWNDFSWPTNKVIKPLSKRDNFDWSRLVALVRLDKATPQPIERVAPVIFYHRTLPDRVSSYVFGFKCNFKANVRCDIFRVGAATPSTTQYLLIDPDELSTARWEAGADPAGTYELRITASREETSIRKIVRFYHQPILR
jgi:hypothetical protein